MTKYNIYTTSRVVAIYQQHRVKPDAGIAGTIYEGRFMISALQYSVFTIRYSLFFESHNIE